MKLYCEALSSRGRLQHRAFESREAAARSPQKGLTEPPTTESLNEPVANRTKAYGFGHVRGKKEDGSMFSRGTSRFTFLAYDRAILSG